MTFNPAVFEDILVCPKSKAKLVAEGNWLVSVDPHTRLKYEIRDEIPIMLVDEAVETPHDEWSAVMEQHGRDPQTGKLRESQQGTGNDVSGR